MKKTVLLTLSVLSIFFVVGCGKKETKKVLPLEDDKLITNNNIEVLKEVEIDGIKISDIAIIKEENITTVSASVTNVTNEVIFLDSVNVTYEFEDGTTSMINLLVDTPIVTQQVVQTSSSTTDDLTKAVKVSYNLVKMKDNQ